MRLKRLLRVALALMSVLLGLSALAVAVPGAINYQGLLEQDGVPVDGSRQVRFRIYDSAEGGDYLWEEIQTVTFTSGVFSVLLGTTEPITPSVFDGGRRWLYVSVDDGPEILPRGELVSVGYAFSSASSESASYAYTAGEAETAQSAAQADNADLLDGIDSSQLAGVNHTHDTRYYRQSQLNTSDGTPPNTGSNLVHWNILTGVPADFADGVDDTGAGITDHGQLTGLLDDDHPQYALKDSLKMSDGTPPNQGRNVVHWSVLTGVPAGFADETDNITTDASLITTGAMSPQRIEGTAVVNSDARLLTTAQKNALTGGGITTLHSHIEVGDISSVTAGDGLSGGGTSGAVTISHAQDASSMAFAHHYPPAIEHAGSDSLRSDSVTPIVVDSVTIFAPDTGFLYVSFGATQQLDIKFEGFPPEAVAKRYIAAYGVSLDQSFSLDYQVTSSMYETDLGLGDYYVPARPVAGTTVIPVTPGSHTVFFLTRLIRAIGSGAENRIKNTSLTAIYFPYDSSVYQGSLLLGSASPGEPGSESGGFAEPGQ